MKNFNNCIVGICILVLTWSDVKIQFNYYLKEKVIWISWTTGVRIIVKISDIINSNSINYSQPTERVL